MKDMQAPLEKHRTETTKCELIASLATDKAQQELFIKAAQHYRVLASEVDRAIKENEASPCAGTPGEPCPVCNHADEHTEPGLLKSSPSISDERKRTTTDLRP